MASVGISAKIAMILLVKLRPGQPSPVLLLRTEGADIVIDYHITHNQGIAKQTVN